MRDERLSTRKLNCGRRPDPGRRRRVEDCAGRMTVGDAPADVEVTITRPHFGGERRWLVCPGCGRRCGVLYRPDPGDAWRCRRCHGLAYRSSQEAHRDEALYVALRRIHAHLERTGGDWDGLLDGLTPWQFLATARALVYLDMARLEDEWRALAEHKPPHKFGNNCRT